MKQYHPRHAAIAVLVVVAALAATPGSAAATDWLPFLMNNRFPGSSMPLSYSITPNDYFETVPDSMKDKSATAPRADADCNNEVISIANQDAYTFQTEKWLSTMGTNIYDAAVWCMAVSLLGQGANCSAYMANVLVGAKTIQFTNIRGTAPCNGVQYLDQCTSNCGFCYGDSAVSLGSDNAYFFRMIADYWAIQGTVDARCPHLNHMWTWNDYKPVLGENAWAQLLGPAQHAMMTANFDASKIPDDHPIFKLGIPFLSTLDTMKVGMTGAFYYTPWNTWFGFTKESMVIGATFSIENLASLTAGLQGLQYILQNKPSSQWAGNLPRVTGYLTGLMKILKESWDPSRKFFRQGGTYTKATGTIQWTQAGQTDFAVDCQTWVASILGTPLMDASFGAGSAYNLWQLTKQLSGWNCPSTGKFCGVGYTYNTISGSVLSGEWTYGAINWLKVMIADSGYDAARIGSLQDDVNTMQAAIATYLYTTASIRSGTYKSVKYADRRYFIPFGWWANSLPSTASTGWAAMVEAEYNPFSVNRGSSRGYATGPAPPPATTGPTTSGAPTTAGPTSGPTTGSSAPTGAPGTSGPTGAPGTGSGAPSGTSGPTGPASSGTSGPTGAPSGTSGPTSPAETATLPATKIPVPPAPPVTTWPGDDSAAPGMPMLLASLLALITMLILTAA